MHQVLKYFPNEQIEVMDAGRVTTLQPLLGMINGGYAVFVSAWQKKDLSKYSRFHSLNLDLQSIWIE